MNHPERPEAASVEVSVLVDSEHLAAIDGVAGALERAGLRVGEVMGTVGVITGTADDAARFPAFEALEGVEAVEIGRKVQLPPPDSPVQ